MRRNSLPAFLENARRCDEGAGIHRTKPGQRNHGLFDFLMRPDGPAFRVLWTAGEGWEHCSVSTPIRPPTWAEMDLVRSWFWDPDEVVVQYHIGGVQKVNCHPFCLHMWRPLDKSIPTPPREFV